MRGRRVACPSCGQSVATRSPRRGDAGDGTARVVVSHAKDGERCTGTDALVEADSVTVGDSPCPQAWHGGLPVGLLVECRLRAGHRGWHRSADGGASWGGVLSEVEVVLADALRATS